MSGLSLLELQLVQEFDLFEKQIGMNCTREQRDNLIGACRVSRVAGKMSWVQKIVAGPKHFKKNSISYFQ